jgi:dephospho-CoA kinase
MKQSERQCARREMRLIGVTGGIGSGKSEVLAYLEKRWGAKVIRLDDISRGLLSENGKCTQAAVELLGREIVMADGTLDRKLIASKILKDEKLRTGLDAIIHPEVKKETLRLVREYRKEGALVCAIEAALLIEEKYDEICDELWYIYASEKTRRERLIRTRGYSEEKIRQFFGRQLSEGEFRRHANLVIDNDGEFSETEKQIDKGLGK